ncbi:MAG TPA: EthD family reductase [Chloroflexia bacterium]|nr:EthD family reductase [Chloroflexia bacterium]
MIKLIALYKRPEDVDAFEQHYNAIHVPLIRKVPHLRNLVAGKVWGAPRGEPAYYRIAEMWFDDRAAFDQAMASDENRAAGKDLMSFAREIVTMIFVDTEATGDQPAGGAGTPAGAA